jgi:hypothetical protein
MAMHGCGGGSDHRATRAAGGFYGIPPDFCAKLTPPVDAGVPDINICWQVALNLQQE